jgi:hypothetical protein
MMLWNSCQPAELCRGDSVFEVIYTEKLLPSTSDWHSAVALSRWVAGDIAASTKRRCTQRCLRAHLSLRNHDALAAASACAARVLSCSLLLVQVAAALVVAVTTGSTSTGSDSTSSTSTTVLVIITATSSTVPALPQY